MASVGLATQPGYRVSLSSCVCDVASWMQSNRLQLNTSKSEVLWCSSVRRQHLIPDTPLIVGVDTSYQPVVSATSPSISTPTSPCGSTSSRQHRAVSVLCVRSTVFVGQSANLFCCPLSLLHDWCALVENTTTSRHCSAICSGSRFRSAARFV